MQTAFDPNISITLCITWVTAQKLCTSPSTEWLTLNEALWHLSAHRLRKDNEFIWCYRHFIPSKWKTVLVLQRSCDLTECLLFGGFT